MGPMHIMREISMGHSLVIHGTHAYHDLSLSQNLETIFKTLNQMKPIVLSIPYIFYPIGYFYLFGKLVEIIS